MDFVSNDEIRAIVPLSFHKRIRYSCVMAGKGNNKDAPKGWFDWTTHKLTKIWKDHPSWPDRSLIVLACTLAGVIGLSIVLGIGRIFAVLSGISGSIEANGRGVYLALVALVGVPFVYWRTWVAHKQADIAEQGLITDRFTKAVDQIGAVREEIDKLGERKIVPNIEVRLGGLYALERIAKDSERDHWQVMEVLTSYVRQNCGEPVVMPFKIIDSSKGLELSLQLDSPKMDVQTALTIIGRRSQKQREIESRLELTIDLTRTNLQNTNLNESNFEGANLSGAHLEGAIFLDTDMENIDLRDAYLEGTSLMYSVLYFANFSTAHLEGAIFNRTWLKGAKFTNSLVWGAQFDTSVNLIQSQVDSMWEGDRATTLPNSIDRPDHWPDFKLSNDEKAERLILWRAGKPPPGKVEET